MTTKDPKLEGLARKESCLPCSPGTSQKICRPPPSAGMVGSDEECHNVCHKKYDSSKYFYEEHPDPSQNRCYCGETSPKKNVLSSIFSEKNEKHLSEKDEIINKSNLKYYGKTIGQSLGGSLRCGNKEMVTTKNTGVNAGKEPADYFTPLKVSDANLARCGCDSSMAQKYNCKIGKNSGKTIASAFKYAADNAPSTADFYAVFERKLKEYTDESGSNIDYQEVNEKLKALIAHEICKFNNISQPREEKPPTLNSDDNTNTAESWLQYKFRGFTVILKIIVVIMVFHLFFRMLFPKGGDFKDSMIYASILPKEFLQDNPSMKILMVSGTMVFFIILISSLMFRGENKENNQKEWIDYIIPSSFPKFLNGGIVSSIYAIIVGAIILKLSNSTKSKILAFVISIVFYLLFTSILAGLKGISIDESIDPSDNKGNTVRYLVTIIALSGLITSIISGFTVLNPVVSMVIFAILLVLFWFLGAGIVSSITGKSFDKVMEWNNNNYNTKLFLTFFFVIIALIGFSVSEMSGNMSIDSFLPFLIATMLGTIPLFIFFFLINFALATMVPMAELAFLFLYRMAGMFSAFFPKNPLGKMLTVFLGIRSTDKWVLPFMPWTMLAVRIFYGILGEPLPGYFKDRITLTGVTNTDMWFS
jgi:hypothetical protein